MPNNGIVIRLFLVDGDAQGLRTAEVMNWTGQLIVGSRSNLKSLGDRPESRKTGVYALIGRDPSDITSNIVYIGESDNVYERLTSHNKDSKKEFWESTILITSKDENLTKTDVRYLESRLIEIASRAKRGTLANGTSPSPPPISEADMAVMDDFLERTRMVISVLGFDFLRTVEISHANSQETAEQSPVFTLTIRGIKANAVETSGEFVVLKGSTVRKKGVKSWDSNVQERERLDNSGFLVPTENEDFLLLTEDTAFTSPSGAAAVLVGANTNGRTAWKVENTKKTYADWQEDQLQ